MSRLLPIVDGQVTSIEALLRHISTVIRRKGREILSDFCITPPQFDALLFLNEHGDLTIGELSNKMYLAYSTTTDLVDRMERNQLVERIRDQNDRRVVRLRMMQKGSELIEKVLIARRTYLANVLDQMDTNERERIIDCLEKLHTNISD
ncbi:MarR family transcriptional regulator [Fodinisporobacter ferrooxydans]|uniref:MarR family transcriptional regulator n=1 Tax=Fodinisporobacter ferrooxydans TaxID=2901836 RepID=A0ABY4CLU3_9BACL|nr:MarR family transcriptional regulator [Alicyclobacillaceae bacterium MYW30-H2]